MSVGPKGPNWDERYAGDDYLYGTEPNDFLKSAAARIRPGSRVLCIADGEGRNGVYLAELGHRVTSIDRSRRGLEKAERLASDRGVELRTVQADLGDHPLGSSDWDCIVSVFFHVPPALRENIDRRVVEALAPGGLLILEGYTPDQLAYSTGGPPTADMMLTMEILESAFGELEFLHAKETTRDVIEGTGHRGRSAVVQLIAEKR